MKSNLKQKLAHIQVNLKAKKSRYNGFGKYNYRAAEDILEAIKPYLQDQKVSVTVNEEMISFDPPILKTVATIYDAESDDAIHSNAIVGVDGKKYALGNLLLIDDTADADASNDHSGKVAKATLTSKKDPLYTKAVKFIEGGGDLAAITGKYDLSSAIKSALKALQPITTETL